MIRRRMPLSCLAVLAVAVAVPAVAAGESAGAVPAPLVRTPGCGRTCALGRSDASSLPWPAVRRPGLAEAIGAAAHVGLVQRGTEAATEALRDCRKGDYPGGGMGLLSLPEGRTQARTDHCWR